MTLGHRRAPTRLGSGGARATTGSVRSSPRSTATSTSTRRCRRCTGRASTRPMLVQAADNADDTANMLAVADRHPEVVGIVAWVPLEDPDAAAADRSRTCGSTRGSSASGTSSTTDPTRTGCCGPRSTPASACSRRPTCRSTTSPPAPPRSPTCPRSRHGIRSSASSSTTSASRRSAATPDARRHWRGLLTEAARNPLGLGEGVRALRRRSGRWTAGPTELRAPLRRRRARASSAPTG